MKFVPGVILCALLAFGRAPDSRLDPLPGEKHLANLRQLTFGGENAEAYFSSKDRKSVV